MAERARAKTTYIETVEEGPRIGTATDCVPNVKYWRAQTAVGRGARPDEHAENGGRTQYALEGEEPSHLARVDVVEGKYEHEVREVCCSRLA